MTETNGGKWKKNLSLSYKFIVTILTEHLIIAQG